MNYDPPIDIANEEAGKDEVIKDYRHECEQCGWHWQSDDAEEPCPECGSDICFHFEN